jgi:hypothetical protein
MLLVVVGEQDASDAAHSVDYNSRMDPKRVPCPTRSTLIIATPMLLLLAIYVSSYVALVDPQGLQCRSKTVKAGDFYFQSWVASSYRCGGQHSERVFWPLEQLDRRIRPKKWEMSFDGWVSDPPPHPPLHSPSLDWLYVERE